MSHANARTTVLGRLLIVQRHRAGWPQAHIAAAMGISRKCVKTWLDRYAAEGEAGLATRSSRPHAMPTRTRRDVEDKVVELRARERRGPDWIGAELGVPARTVSRVLARHRVPHLCDLDALPLAKREGRKTQQDPADRMGLPSSLQHQHRPHRRPCTLDRALQHSTTSQRTRRTPTGQPPATNLMTRYT